VSRRHGGEEVVALGHRHIVTAAAQLVPGFPSMGAVHGGRSSTARVVAGDGEDWRVEERPSKDTEEAWR
jgi:hypothetical protein